MKTPIVAYTPIFNELDTYHSHGIDITFVYGDRDWLNTAMNGRKVSKQLKDRGEKVLMVEDSDHHLYMDNPQGLLETLDQ